MLHRCTLILVESCVLLTVAEAIDACTRCGMLAFKVH